MSTEITITSTTIDINVTEYPITIEAPSGAYPLPTSVYSVFGRTGNVVATEGDYTLTQLAGVTITSPSAGQALVYNGTSWVNNTETYVGTVTSVSATVPTGLTITGSPITTSGTLAFGLQTGYSIPTTAKQTTWDTAYSDSIVSAAVTGTTTKTLTLNQQDGGTVTANWSDLQPVTSVFGRTGDVVATSGDYNTLQVTENTNLYFTEQRARFSISGSSASGVVYSNTTGIIALDDIPNTSLFNDSVTINSKTVALGGSTTLSTTDIGEGTNLYFTTARAQAAISGTAPISVASGVVSISQSGPSTNGYLSSADWNTFNNKQIALTFGNLTSSDITVTGGTGAVIGAGSTMTLATVNANTGTFGSSTAIPVITVNGKGLITALTTTAVSIPSGSLSFIGDVTGTGTTGSDTTLTLATVNTNVGAYGSSTNVPTITVNAKGLVTAASQTAIPTATSSVTGLLTSTDWSTFNGKQNALNGTGFVKVTGTTVSYDNSTYLTTIEGIAASGELSGTYASPSLVNSAVTGKVLTGVNITGGTIADTDSILTAFGKVQNQINGLIGGSIYKGTWNASTNTPTLTSSVGTAGNYYIVSVAGTTNLNGITDWQIGDWVIYQGTEWEKVDNTDAVVSVNGYTGAVSLTTSDISEGTNLYYTDVRARASNSAGTGISYNSTSGVITNSAPDQTVSLTASTGISTSGTYPSFTITNTAPDQTVALTSGTGISATGTYPNFTITNTAPDQVVALTQGGTTTISGTYPNFTISSADQYVGTVTSVGITESSAALSITGSPVTTSGNINIGFAGSASQYVAGDGSLVTFPSIVSQAENLVTDVYNSTGATLSKGTIVYINGGQGNLPTVTKALASADSTSAQTYGVVQTDITNMNNGYVIAFGSLGDLDTQAYAAGTQLYLSGTTAGAWTSTKPYAPIHLVYVAVVTRSHPTQGVVEIRIQNGYELDELHNVSAQSPSNGDILQYVSSTSLWTKTAGTTSAIAEGANLYYTDARSRAAISLTTTSNSGASTYNNTTGVLNVPTYTLAGLGGINLSSLSATSPLLYDNTTGVFSIQQSSGSQAGYLSSADWTTFNSKQGTITLTTTGSSGASTLVSNTLNIPTYTLSGLGGVPTTRTLTINGTGYDLSADRSWTIPTSVNATFTQDYTATAAQTTFTVTGGYTVGQLAVYYNGSKLANAEFTATNGTTFVLATACQVNDIVQAVAEITGGGIGGSGTTNYHSKWTASGVLGNSLIWDNGTNVGLSTVSPVTTNLVGSMTIVKSYNSDTPTSTTAQAYYTNQSNLYLFGRNAGLSIICPATNEEGSIFFGNSLSVAYASINTGSGTTSVGGDMNFRVGSNTTRMTITSAGNVGIGTSSPSKLFTVVASADGQTAGISGATYGLRFDNGGSFAFGGSTIHGVDNTLTATYQILGLNGSQVIFGTSGTERMRITSGGNLVINGTTAAYPSTNRGNLTLSGSASALLGFHNGTTQTGYIYNDHSVNLFQWYSVSNPIEITSTSLGVRLNVSATSWSPISSDERTKKNFETTQGLIELLQIEPVKYHFIEEDDNKIKRLGFKAQNLQPLIPEMVYSTGKKMEDGSDILTITPDYLLPVLVKAIKELNTKLDEQNQTIQSLQEQINILAK